MYKHYQHLKEKEPFWPNNSIYFLTESTFLHFPYFKSFEQKLIVFNIIKKLNKNLNIPVSAYSIAQNHLHIKFYLKHGLLLSKVKQLVRGGVSYDYRRKFKIPYKEMWQSRKTIIIKSEKMDWAVTGYIIGNLLKHKEVSTFKKLKNNQFSSYWYMADKYGDSEMQALVRSVIDVDEDAWGGVNMGSLNKINVNNLASKSLLNLHLKVSGIHIWQNVW
jgi:hypothetical protein